MSVLNKTTDPAEAVAMTVSTPTAATTVPVMMAIVLMVMGTSVMARVYTLGNDKSSTNSLA